MAQDVLNADLLVNGNISSKTLTVPSGTITNAMVSAAAAIQRTKCEDSFSVTVDQTGTIVAATKYLRVIRGATADVVGLQAAITEAIATGADRTVTIDLKRSTGGGAFASILSATVVFNNVSTLRAVTSAAFSSTALVVGDILQLTVAVAGAAGAQATGLAVSLTLREDPS